MIKKENNTTISLYEFAWNSLTDQQRFRVKVKYDLSKRLDSNKGCKRDVYRAIASKYGYTMERVEYIAVNELKNK